MNKEISKKEQDRIIQGALASAEELKKNMEEYFATVDKYFENMDKNVDKYYSNVNKNIDKLCKSLGANN
ncbi:hypothetical protein SAMN05216497_11929 [Clostridium cochlearium]|uniref:Uncharacterized protein n=1 Tax=Clostridium cochlearium TaxID=1494 RepID=A0ABY0QN26_CLOCO|nr:hypothetical protein [Clostridium cochlearium]SDL32234.1 hypothetical protein SAMN05216497_11929 [Clostridium cochlearium]